MIRNVKNISIQQAKQAIEPANVKQNTKPASTPEPVTPAPKPATGGADALVAKTGGDTTGLLQANLLEQIPLKISPELAQPSNPAKTPIVGEATNKNPNLEPKRELLPIVQEADPAINGPEFEMVPGRLRAPLYVKDGTDVDEVDMDDVDQGAIADCYLLASIAAIARQNPEAIKNMIRDNNDGTYTVTFKQLVSTEPRMYQDIPVTVTADFPGGLTGPHAQPGDNAAYGKKEIWPLIIEKAYAQLKAGYPGISSGGKPEYVLEELTGHAVKTFPDMSNIFADPFGNKVFHPDVGFKDLKANFDAGKPVTFSTLSPGLMTPGAYGLVTSHAYTLDKVYTDANGKRWVQLYNPWGNTHPAPIPFEEIPSLFRSVAISDYSPSGLFAP